MIFYQPVFTMNKMKEIKQKWRETSGRWGGRVRQGDNGNGTQIRQIWISDPQIRGQIPEFISGDPVLVIWWNLSFNALLAEETVLQAANFPEGYFLRTFNYFPQELKQSGLIGLVECIYFWPQKATAGWDVKYHRMEIWDSGLSATGSRKPGRHGAPNYGAGPAGAAGMAEGGRFGTEADADDLPDADSGELSTGGEEFAADIGAVAAALPGHQCPHRAPPR